MPLDPITAAAFFSGAGLVFLWHFFLTQRATKAALSLQLEKRDRYRAISDREEVRKEEVRLRKKLWDIRNPYNQLRFVQPVAFRSRKLIDCPVLRVALQVIEGTLEGLETHHRVLAGVPLCSFLQTTGERGQSEQRASLAIRDKQVDFLIIDVNGDPRLVIEKRKAGDHTQATLGAVKQKALENAGIPILFISAKTTDAELRARVIWQLSPR